MSDDANDPTPRGMKRGLTSYGDAGFSLFLRKAFIKGAGYSDTALDRPVIGITDTGSGYNPCHGNMPQLLEALERGILMAGGLPVKFPTISIHESFAHPTSMYLRNLMSMDTEEMVKAAPMDAVVLIGGCDKTVPAQLMGAASAGIPAVQLVTGSMLTGSHRGEVVGACTDCRRYWGKFRAEEIDQAEIDDVNNQLVPSVGTCSVMGTASTMACIAEALGISVPGGATPPAVTADRMRIAERSGATAVALAKSRLTIDRILTPASFENALRVLLAIGGSTNGIVHLTAIAGRLGYEIDLEGLDRMGRETPWSSAEIEAWADSKPRVDRVYLREGLRLTSGPWEQGLFSELTVPTLIVTPVDGEMAPDPALIGNPLVRCVEIEGAGHCVRRDRPEAYFAAVDAFLAGV